MISTIDTDLKMVTENGKKVLRLVPKNYPDWYGIEGVGFIFRGCWSDPELEYKGHVINSFCIENALWEDYHEYCDENNMKPDDDKFAEYVLDNKECVYELLEEYIGGEDK